MLGPASVQPLVLVVEDEPQMRRVLVSTLAAHGFRSLHAGTAARMLARAVAHDPDLILLDIAQGGMDAVAFTAGLRERTAAPILVMLVQPGEQERAAVLDAGANDYVVKPFRTGDLFARMRVWLRHDSRVRSARAMSEPRLRFKLDRERRSLYVEGREVHITPLEYKMLSALAREPGRILTEEQMVAAVWGRESFPQPQSLRAHVRQLRHKLERDPSRPRYLVTESAGGYRLRLG
jgi:two-component system, OmpR family, KDP operon response regulator KdpE